MTFLPADTLPALWESAPSEAPDWDGPSEEDMQWFLAESWQDMAEAPGW